MQKPKSKTVAPLKQGRGAKKGRSRSPQFVRDAAQGAAAGTVKPSLDALQEIAEGLSETAGLAEQWKNTHVACQAGRMAEVRQVTDFNRDAAIKGLPYRASTTAANGGGCDAADILIRDTRTGQLVNETQAKFCGSSAKTAVSVSDAKYKGMGKVVPSDQLTEVKQKTQNLHRKYGATRPKYDFDDTSKNASDRLRFKGAESKPLSTEQARDLPKNHKAVYDKLTQHETLNAMGKSAAVAGAVGGVLSAGSNVTAVIQGTKTAKEAALDTVVDTAGCGATAATVTVVSIGVKGAMVSAGAKTLAGGSAPVAAAVALVEVGKDVARLVGGSIDGEEFVAKTGGNIIKGASTWGGTEAGAIVGSVLCPGIGTVIGGIVGGIAGGLFGGWVARSSIPQLGPSLSTPQLTTS